MITRKDLEKRIQTIEIRNARVEKDKQWETSCVRRGALVMFTYGAVGLYLDVIHVANPWLNAIVPAVGFFLSTLTLGILKKYWMKKEIS